MVCRRCTHVDRGRGDDGARALASKVVFGEEAVGGAKYRPGGVCDPLNKFRGSAGWWVVEGTVCWASARVVVQDLLPFADGLAVRDVSQERYGGHSGGESG
jgi:hypothetical protein